jgi:PleD family two-component response regulator
VTVSVGAAMARRDEDWASLVARADEMLYASKAGGRNLVTIAE